MIDRARCGPLLALLVVGLLGTAGIAAAAVTGSPDLSVAIVEDTVAPGETATVEVVVVNSGTVETRAVQDPSLTAAVTTARGLSVDLDAGRGPFRVPSNAVAIGSLGVGASDPVGFTVVVEEDADPGTYDVPVTLEYEYTSYVSETDGTQDERSVRRTTRVPLTVESAPRFVVRNVTSTARVGARGAVVLTVENAGDAVANDTELTLASESGDLSVGTGSPATRYVDRWEPGETRTLRYAVTVGESAEPGEYAATLSGRYTDADGRRRNASARTVGVETAPRQRFAVVDTESAVPVGGTGTYAVTVHNEGPRAVSDASLTLTAASPDLTLGGGESASRHVGRWEPGETRTVRFEVSATQGADRQEYALSLAGAYTDESGTRRAIDERSVGLSPGRGQQFSVVDAETDVTVGTSGTYRLTVHNDGPRAVEDARVVLTTESGAVTVGGDQSGSRYVGRWPANETRTVTFGVTATDAADAQTYAVSAAVEYEDPAGEEAAATGLATGLRPVPAPTFAVTETGTRLRAGSEGVVSGTVRNRGDSVARDAVLVVESAPAGVALEETRVPLGDIRPNASIEFRVPASVAPSARAGTRSLSVRVEYDPRAGDDERSTGSLRTLAVDVVDEDVLALSAVDGRVPPDSDTRFRVRVDNLGDGPLRNVEAALAVGPPFTSDSPTAFVDRLDPGETAVLSFQLSVSDDAVESHQSLPVNVTAETADGHRITARDRVAVTVAEEAGGPTNDDTVVLAVGSLVVLAILGIGWLWLRQ